jgi:uncharacterized protein (DUF302 family)
MITKKSHHDVQDTLDRLETALKHKGIAVTARIDHAAAARKVGGELRPTQLLVFGNPKLGTPLMQSNQRVGLDLPLKVLAWEDAQGQVWLGYTPPREIATRHTIADRATVIETMSVLLDDLTNQAAGP